MSDDPLRDEANKCAHNVANLAIKLEDLANRRPHAPFTNNGSLAQWEREYRRVFAQHTRALGSYRDIQRREQREATA
jgi:hypothetical protein